MGVAYITDIPVQEQSELAAQQWHATRVVYQERQKIELLADYLMRTRVRAVETVGVLVVLKVTSLHDQSAMSAFKARTRKLCS
jgi:hypothetical protein